MLLDHWLALNYLSGKWDNIMSTCCLQNCSTLGYQPLMSKSEILAKLPEGVILYLYYSYWFCVIKSPFRVFNEVVNMARHVGKYYVCCVCQNFVCGVYPSTCGVYADYVWRVCKLCVMCMSKSCVRCILTNVCGVPCRNLVWCACRYLVWYVCKNRARCERQNVLCAHSKCLCVRQNS